MMMMTADNPADTLAGTRSLADWIARGCARLRRRHDLRRTQAALSELSDATLHDIGLRRFEIGGVAGHPRFTGRR